MSRASLSAAAKPVRSYILVARLSATVAKERRRKELCDVEILVIDLIAPDVDDASDDAERERLKLGSTAIRAWLANGRQRPES